MLQLLIHRPDPINHSRDIRFGGCFKEHYPNTRPLVKRAILPTEEFNRELVQVWQESPSIATTVDDLTAGIINFQQATLASNVQYAVARKLLDSQQIQGAAMVKLIDAANIGVNKSADQLVAAATGLGGEVDTYA